MDENSNQSSNKILVREQVLSKLDVNGNKVTPNRSNEETKSALAERNILDQEYNGREGNDPYVSVSINDLSGSNAGKEVESSDNLIGHTDAIRFNGKIYNVCVAKTVTEVLNQLTDGKYMQIQFYVNFNRGDAASLESNLRNFIPRHAMLPRSRISTKLEDGLIVVEPNLNGFKITALMEDLDNKSYEELDSLNRWIENLQGFILEESLKILESEGVAIEDLAKSQVTVGLIPRARRLYESKKARVSASEGESPVITPAIKEDSAKFAEELNDELQLLPLTGSTVGIGTQVSVIEVSTNPIRIDSWQSARRNFSYFRKGVSAGRINRISGSYRYTPILSQMEETVAQILGSIIPYVLNVFENTVRRQMDIAELPAEKLPEMKSPEYKNIQELFQMKPEELRKLEDSYIVKVDDKIKEVFKNEETRKIASLLDSLRNMN